MLIRTDIELDDTGIAMLGQAQFDVEGYTTSEGEGSGEFSRNVRCAYIESVELISFQLGGKNVDRAFLVDVFGEAYIKSVEKYALEDEIFIDEFSEAA